MGRLAARRRDTRRRVLAGGAAVGGAAVGAAMFAPPAGAAVGRRGAAAAGVAIVAGEGEPAHDYIGSIAVQRYFPETGHNVDGALLAYFWAHGGPDVIGYPLTEEYWTPAAPGGAGRIVQYFQRARLEFDPAGGAVSRSPLGELLGKSQPAVPPAAGARYYPETGHNVAHAFLVFLVEAGGVASLGYPISEEVAEHGRPVQWFQNARLEWWPEHSPDRRVQPGLVGSEYLAAGHESIPEAALAPAPPLAPLREWALPPVPPAPRVAWAPLDIPILYYHHVPSEAQLRGQVRAFKAAGRQIIPLSDAVAALRGERALPDSPLVLTFDDGWASQFRHAAPVLQTEDVPATFFVITRYLGALPGYMTWDEVRVLKELGHEVESHTQNHPSLDALHAEDEGAAVAEIWESLAVLEARLGRSRRLFAYPNGHWSEAVANLVRRVYYGAVATGGGTFQSQDRLHAMRRIKAEPHYNARTLLAQMG